MYVWIYSLGSAFFISLAGIWGYILLPLITGEYREHVMNVLVGLSFGSLITSSLCQLIPEAYELSSSSNKYLEIAIFSMLGLWITSLAQSLATIIGDDSQESITNRADSIKKSPNETTNKFDEQPLNEKTNNGYPMYPQESNQEVAPPTDGSKMSVEMRRSTLFHRSSFASIKSNAKLSKLAIVILAGDCMNNFMDGISIGAGYSFHLSTGIKLSTAIAFEEYTHKLGDFAIVYQSGISMKRVLFWNYSTSCACFVGVVIGIALGNLQWSQYIFSFASGLFLYIALSNMIPELQNMLNDSLKKSKKSALISLLEQHVGFILAFGVLIATSVLLNVNQNSGH
ncbi:metal cation symporter ZIP8-like isoform X2 [Planococcus citri]